VSSRRCSHSAAESARASARRARPRGGAAGRGVLTLGQIRMRTKPWRPQGEAYLSIPTPRADATGPDEIYILVIVRRCRGLGGRDRRF